MKTSEEYNFQERGVIDVKGKGKMITYFLIGYKGKQLNVPYCSRCQSDNDKNANYAPICVRGPDSSPLVVNSLLRDLIQPKATDLTSDVNQIIGIPFQSTQSSRDKYWCNHHPNMNNHQTNNAIVKSELPTPYRVESTKNKPTSLASQIPANRDCKMSIEQQETDKLATVYSRETDSRQKTCITRPSSSTADKVNAYEKAIDDNRQVNSQINCTRNSKILNLESVNSESQFRDYASYQFNERVCSLQSEAKMQLHMRAKKDKTANKIHITATSEAETENNYGVTLMRYFKRPARQLFSRAAVVEEYFMPVNGNVNVKEPQSVLIASNNAASGVDDIEWGNSRVTSTFSDISRKPTVEKIMRNAQSRTSQNLNLKSSSELNYKANLNLHNIHDVGKTSNFTAANKKEESNFERLRNQCTSS